MAGNVRGARHDGFHVLRDVGELEVPLEEAVHKHFVRGIHHRMDDTATAARLEREGEAAELIEVRLEEGKFRKHRQVDTLSIERQAVGPRERHLDRNAHVGRTKLRHEGTVAADAAVARESVTAAYCFKPSLSIWGTPVEIYPEINISAKKRVKPTFYASIWIQAYPLLFFEEF